MNSILKSQEKVYEYTWPKDQTYKTKIKFLYEEGKWEFAGIDRPYGYSKQDWQFLADLSKEVLELIEKETR